MPHLPVSSLLPSADLINIPDGLIKKASQDALLKIQHLAVKVVALRTRMV